MIAVVNYGMGNLRSVSKAVEKLGVEVKIADNPGELAGSSAVILPGVGAFGAGIKNLKKSGFDKAVKKLAISGTPLLGICLGYQLLFEQSFEKGTHKGLGLVEGDVRLFSGIGQDLRIPHMGWNSLVIKKTSPLYKGVGSNPFVYFVHSYYCRPKDNSLVSAWTDYGARFAASIEKSNIYGVQFHPEKSGSAGMSILKNFISAAKSAKLGAKK